MMILFVSIENIRITVVYRVNQSVYRAGGNSEN